MQISEALYAWLAILVLPINSALNPVLYTLTTTTFMKQVNSQSTWSIRSLSWKLFDAMPMSCFLAAYPEDEEGNPIGRLRT